MLFKKGKSIVNFILEIWYNSAQRVHHLREEFKTLGVITDGFKKQARAVSSITV